MSAIRKRKKVGLLSFAQTRVFPRRKSFVSSANVDRRVFFKTCKSYLNLIGERRSLSCDALTAHAAIVIARYMGIALEQRKIRTGELWENSFLFHRWTCRNHFCAICQILPKAMVESICAIFQVEGEQMNTFRDLFVEKLPSHIQNASAKGAATAWFYILLAVLLSFQRSKPIFGMGSFNK